MNKAWGKKRIAENEQIKPDLKKKRTKSKIVVLVGTVLLIIDIILTYNRILDISLGAVFFFLIFCSMIVFVWMIYKR
ncbi:MAG: hypothetical protein ACTSW7_02400 [Candidatus Thorarchaeota archaeon]